MIKKIVTISDHAVLRYLERVHKVDVDAIRLQIEKGLRKEILNAVGNNKVIIKTNECDFVVENGVVITILN